MHKRQSANVRTPGGPGSDQWSHVARSGAARQRASGRTTMQVRAADTAAIQQAGRRRGRRMRALLASTLVISGVAVVLNAAPAHAAVPSFPDNILVFPNRDFVSVAGYSGHQGETATLEVHRAGVGIVGSAQAVVSGGDVAFEVNHPGGSAGATGRASPSHRTSCPATTSASASRIHPPARPPGTRPCKTPLCPTSRCSPAQPP